jgi:hypothetical protein
MELSKAKREAKEFAGYWLSDPNLLADASDKEETVKQLKEACRILDDPSQIEKVRQLIKSQ